MRFPGVLDLNHPIAARIVVALPVGATAAAAVGTTAGWQYAPAAGWIAAAAIYLLLTWTAIVLMDPAAIEAFVRQKHPTRRPGDALVVLASIASLGGVAYLLTAPNVKGPDTAITAAVGFLSVIASWLAVNTVYTLRYAMYYYTEPIGGIDFNQDDKPIFADFAYLAFTVAVTYGVTDTTVSSRRIRMAVLQQAIVTYLFGTIIVALTIQVIGSLSSM